MQGSWDQSVFLGLAAARIGDRYVVGFQRTAESPFEVGFGLGEIGKRAKFGAARGDQVALRKNHLVNGGCAELILLLFGVKGLLLQFTSFAGGFHSGTVLNQSNVSILNVENGAVLELLDLRLHLPLGQSCTLVISLSDPVADRYRHTQLNGIGREIVVKNLARSIREAFVISANSRRYGQRLKQSRDRVTVCIHNLCACDRR